MRNIFFITIILCLLGCKTKETVVENLSWVSKDKGHIELTDSVSVYLKPQEKFPDIKSIKISFAPLFSISDIDFSKFPNLEKIEIANSMIDTLDLDKLEIDKTKILELQLSNNKLRYIKGIASCKNLEILNLSFNKFQKLPDGVELLPKLKDLNIIGTPIEKHP